MKLIIKSKQNYKTHVEEFTEVFECTINIEENILKINFDNGFIQIEDNKIAYERGENKIVIEPNKTNECDYETQYGMFVLDIKGLSVNKEIEDMNLLDEPSFSGLVAKAIYEIQMVGVETYENAIEIELSNN